MVFDTFIQVEGRCYLKALRHARLMDYRHEALNYPELGSCWALGATVTQHNIHITPHRSDSTLFVFLLSFRHQPQLPAAPPVVHLHLTQEAPENFTHQIKTTQTHSLCSANVHHIPLSTSVAGCFLSYWSVYSSSIAQWSLHSVVHLHSGFKIVTFP